MLIFQSDRLTIIFFLMAHGLSCQRNFPAKKTLNPQGGQIQPGLKKKCQLWYFLLGNMDYYPEKKILPGRNSARAYFRNSAKLAPGVHRGAFLRLHLDRWDGKPRANERIFLEKGTAVWTDIDAESVFPRKYFLNYRTWDILKTIICMKNTIRPRLIGCIGGGDGGDGFVGTFNQLGTAGGNPWTWVFVKRKRNFLQTSRASALGRNLITARCIRFSINFHRRFWL